MGEWLVHLAQPKVRDQETSAAHGSLPRQFGAGEMVAVMDHVRFPLPPGEGQGEGPQGQYKLPLTPALSQGESEYSALNGG